MGCKAMHKVSKYVGSNIIVVSIDVDIVLTFGFVIRLLLKSGKCPLRFSL